MQYEAGLRLAENIICFVGAISVSWARAESFASEALDAWQNSLKGGGLSLGHWVAVSEAVNRSIRHQEHVASDDLVETIQQLTHRRQMLPFLKDLVGARNADAHGGRPHGRVEIARRLDRLVPALSRALDASAILSSTELFQIEDSTLKRGSAPIFGIRALRLRGDHPDFETANFESSLPHVRGAVVLQTGTEMLDLTPFVLVEYCEQCGGREVFFPDKMRGEEAIFKSFDHRHEHKDGQWNQELRFEGTYAPRVVHRALSSEVPSLCYSDEVADHSKLDHVPQRRDGEELPQRRKQSQDVPSDSAGIPLDGRNSAHDYDRAERSRELPDRGIFPLHVLDNVTKRMLRIDAEGELRGWAWSTAEATPDGKYLQHYCGTDPRNGRRWIMRGRGGSRSDGRWTVHLDGAVDPIATVRHWKVGATIVRDYRPDSS